MTIQSIKPFFHGNYSDATLDELSDDVYEHMNKTGTIPTDEDGFMDGHFEVLVNWIND